MRLKRTISIFIFTLFFSVCVTTNVFAVHTTEEISTTETTLTSAQEDIILQLQKKIDELQKTIALMQTQIDSLIKTKSSVSEVKKVSTKEVPKKVTAVSDKFSKSLYVGVVGDEVTLLQEFLAGDSDIYPEGKVTGYFGPLTKAAVKRFQEKNGIETVGIVGPKTRAKMNAFMEGEQYSYKEKTATQEKTKEQTKTTEVQSTVKSIAVIAGDNGKITWETVGNSPKGFKIVWSKTSGPAYPTRSGDKYQYLSNPDANSVTLTSFDGVGIYYVRVCEYLGGKCGVYSNEVQIELTD